MANQVTWYGSQQESFDLVNAIARNCTCEFGLMGVRLSTCPPHQMLTEDQRALNGLLFARRMADRLRREEWETGDTTAPPVPGGKRKANASTDDRDADLWPSLPRAA
jgi:hypothetical protein